MSHKQTEALDGLTGLPIAASPQPLPQFWREVGIATGHDARTLRAAWMTVTGSPRSEVVQVLDHAGRQDLLVRRLSNGPIKRPDGSVFRCFQFQVGDRWRDYSVLFHGPINEDLDPQIDWSRPVAVRLDSGCATGQIFRDTECDCAEQLDAGLKLIASTGQGFLVHMPTQDGRGHGISTKLQTLYLQHVLGVDCVVAAKMILGEEPLDHRDYLGAIAILKTLGLPHRATIEVAAFNPQKLQAFSDNGFTPVQRELTTTVSGGAKRNADAKERELGHLGLSRATETQDG